MDIKKSILELLKPEYNIRYSNMAIEKLILTVFQHYLKRQNKEMILSRDSYQRITFDAVLPEGFDTVSGKVDVELKIHRNTGLIIRELYNIIGRIVVNEDNISTLLLVMVNEIPDKIKQKSIAKQNI